MAGDHFESIRLDRSGGVVTVTLDRPERKNAADLAMWRELRAVFDEVAVNAEDRVVVVTGADGDFCSGADLGDAEQLRLPHLARMRYIGEVCLALHRLPVPTIARVDGVAAGAGCNLALACDLVVASDRARFTQIFARRGLSLDFGGSWLLPRLVGLHRAKELALFADDVDAAAAERLGLANRVVPVEQLDAVVGEWAARLADGPTIALGLTKRMLNDAFERTLADAIEDEARSQVVNFHTADTREAISAFLERRPPRFEGR